jgi:DNA-binding MarR family transcriptional regulator/GNAT superfamily N-acetyltransferase
MPAGRWAMAQTQVGARVSAMRGFNRFYTKKIGVLHEGFLDSPFTLAEGRVLYELAHHKDATATAIGRELGLDNGYLSRILQKFRRQRLVGHEPSRTDGRQRLLSLTDRGRRAIATLNTRSDAEIGRVLGALSTHQQRRILDAMRTIEELLQPAKEQCVPYVLRPPQPGDMGWVVQRHGALYAQEYGWTTRFEALVARIVARFVEHENPARERCWIAERDGEPVGSVFLVERSKTVAQLRLLLVEPSARGLGIGTRLVQECDRFARQAGYRKIRLWTQSMLAPARRVYEREGYRLVSEEPHHSFGHDLVGEIWEKKLHATDGSTARVSSSRTPRTARSRRGH